MMHAVINHLWQSTVFAILLGILALAFRRNHAQVRYWLWFSTSVKFLVPFALLLSLGGYLGRSPVAKDLWVPAIPYAVVQVAEPFPVQAPAAPPAENHVDWVPIVLASLWMCGFLSVTLSRGRAWLRIRTALRSSTPLEISFPVPVRSTTHLFEPGIIGFFRPRLLLPAGMREHVTPEQLQVVLTHELCHVRRRDNLTATIHMVVEALFWFHPLVWWISARLMEERERACDETVLELGGEPQVYAESILKICQLCIQSPLACVPGMAGASLKKRVVRIMGHRGVLKLDVRRKLLLAVAGFLSIAVPIGFGLANGRSGQANAPQSFAFSQVADTTTATGVVLGSALALAFEVASISPQKPGRLVTVEVVNRPNDGRFYASGVTVMVLLQLAYGVQRFQVLGAPNWANSERFNVEAKSDSAVDSYLRKLGARQGLLAKQRMLQALLADRFKLKLHRGTKNLPLYALVVAEHGPKLQKSKNVGSKSSQIGNDGGHQRRHLVFVGEDMELHLSAKDMSMSSLVDFLQAQVERTVVDRTGLTGKYDIALKCAQNVSLIDRVGGGPAAGFPGPSIFTALQQQLGLKLKPAKGPVEVLVVDNIEQPTAN